MQLGIRIGIYAPMHSLSSLFTFVAENLVFFLHYHRLSLYVYLFTLKVNDDLMAQYSAMEQANDRGSEFGYGMVDADEAEAEVLETMGFAE